MFNYFIFAYFFIIYGAGEAAEQELFKLGNEYREENGLPPLIENPKLKSAAENQAKYCAENNILSHDQKNETDATLGLRVDKAGYQWVSIAENVAQNNGPDAEKTLKQWINSPGHNKNLLSKNREVGYASASSPDGKIYWAGVYASSGEEGDADSQEPTANIGSNDTKKESPADEKENNYEKIKRPTPNNKNYDIKAETERNNYESILGKRKEPAYNKRTDDYTKQNIKQGNSICNENKNDSNLKKTEKKPQYNLKNEKNKTYKRPTYDKPDKLEQYPTTVGRNRVYSHCR